MIIIPDIHGREHWKADVAKVTNEDGSLKEKVVFLGDYLDHYNGQKNGGEPITMETAMSNFKEIIGFKKSHGDDVVLLLGNHDIEYMDNRCPACRCYTSRYDEIRSLFMENIGLFDVGHHVEADGVTFILSHATISAGWVLSQRIFEDKYVPSVDELEDMPEEDFENNAIKTAERFAEVVDDMNSMLHSGDEAALRKLMMALSAVSPYRGGWAPYASPLWEDFREHDDMLSCRSVYQIVGHTQHSASGGRLMAKHDSVCLDCHMDEIGNRLSFRLVPFRDNGDGYMVPVEAI